MMSLKEICQRDLMDAAIHEAGHAIVDLQTGGVGGNIELYRVEAADGLETRLWAGRYTGFRIQDKAAVGLAGTLAVFILAEDEIGCTDPAGLAFEFVDYIEGSALVLSATDAALAGDYSVEDAERTLRILIENWALVIDRALLEMKCAQDREEAEAEMDFVEALQ